MTDSTNSNPTPFAPTPASESTPATPAAPPPKRGDAHSVVRRPSPVSEVPAAAVPALSMTESGSFQATLFWEALAAVKAENAPRQDEATKPVRTPDTDVNTAQVETKLSAESEKETETERVGGNVVSRPMPTPTAKLREEKTVVLSKPILAPTPVEWITLEGQTYRRLSDEEALAKIIRGEPLEGCYVKSLHLGYQADLWISPSDVGTTRWLANHFKVPDNISLARQGGKIPVLKYREPVSILGCVIEEFSASGVTFRASVTIRNTLFLGHLRLDPPDGADLSRAETAIPPTVFEGDVVISGVTVKGDVRLTRAVFQRTLDLSRVKAQHLHVEQCSFQGAVNATQLNVAHDASWTHAKTADALELSHGKIGGTLNLSHAQFAGPVVLNATTCGAFDASMARFGKRLDLPNVRVAEMLNLSAAIVEGDCDLSNTIIGDDLVLTDAKLRGPLNAYRLKVENHFRAMNTRFAADVSFRDLSVKDSADFGQAVFEALADFRRATFGQWFIFFETHLLKGGDFFGARFEGECLFNRDRSARQSWGNQLHDRVAKVGGPLTMRGAYFYRKAVFDGVEFPTSLGLDHAYFAEQASFNACVFHGPLDLTEARALQELDFTDARFHSHLNLARATLSGPIDLTGVELTHLSCAGAVLEMLIVERRQVEHAIRGPAPDGKPKTHAATCDEYQVLKSSFARRGRQDEEDWTYAEYKRAERRARWDALHTRRLTLATRFLNYLRFAVETVVFDWFGEYGTNPKRTAILALLVILAFGLIYTACDMLGEPLVWSGSEFESQHESAQSLPTKFVLNTYFSFMAFTTVNFGDVHPNFYGWVKIIAACEGFIGLFLITLFVGTYARKIIR